MSAGRLSVFSGAAMDLGRLVGGLATRIHCAGGTTLFRQGDAGDAFFLVREGEIEISVLSSTGRRLALDVMRKGDVLGEIALFGGSRTATAIALKPSVLDQVRRSDVLAAMRSSPDLALPARLASRLLHLDDKIGDGGGGVPISQADLADFAGATREGVAKILGEWRALGWVSLSRGTVHILNRRALDAVAHIAID